MRPLSGFRPANMLLLLATNPRRAVRVLTDDGIAWTLSYQCAQCALERASGRYLTYHNYVLDDRHAQGQDQAQCVSCDRRINFYD